MNQSSSCVAVYSSYTEELDSIFDMIEVLISLDYSATKLSVIGKGSSSEDDAIGIYKSLDQTRFKGKQNEFWQTLWNLLSGEAFFLIPEFGSLTVAGGLSSILLADNVDNSYPQTFSTLGKALHCLGVPENSIYRYESALKAGKLILIIHGNNQEVEKAGDLLEALQNNKEVSLHFVNTN